MKRMIGLILSIGGGTALVWGGICLLTGSTDTRVTLADGVSLNAMTGGLIGAAALTLGLVWVRD